MLAAVFIAVSHWMYRAGKKPKAAACMEKTAQQLAKCIRFPMLTNDFLHFVVTQVGFLLWALGGCLPPACVRPVCMLCNLPSLLQSKAASPQSSTQDVIDRVRRYHYTVSCSRLSTKLTSQV